MTEEKILKISKKDNNVFSKEKCCLCDKFFDADDSSIWECYFGYVCRDCINKIDKWNKKK